MGTPFSKNKTDGPQSRIRIETESYEADEMLLIPVKNVIYYAKVIQRAYRLHSRKKRLSLFVSNCKTNYLTRICAEKDAKVVSNDIFIEGLDSRVKQVFDCLTDSLPDLTAQTKDLVKLMLPPLYIKKPKECFYKGGWNLKHQFEGKGTLITAKGELFTGVWRENTLEGTGMAVYLSGAHYIGAFKDSKFEGFGQFTDKEGTVYKGNWLGSLKHGQGREEMFDGTVREGLFEKGVFVSGTLIDSEGTRFEGEFSNNRLKHGSVELLSGASFNGSLAEGFYSKGCYKFPSGRYYEGEYRRGKKHGYGKYNFKNGYYRGNWAFGYQNGQGKLSYKEVELEGVWKFGSLVSVLISSDKLANLAEYHIRVEEEEHPSLTNTMLSAILSTSPSKRGVDSFISLETKKNLTHCPKISESSVSTKTSKTLFKRKKGFNLASSHIYLEKLSETDFKTVGDSDLFVPLNKKFRLVSSLKDFNDLAEEGKVAGIANRRVRRYFGKQKESFYFSPINLIKYGFKRG